MPRPDPPVLAGLDEHDAIHHFIRVQGRRPTPEELSRQVGGPVPPPPSTSSAVSGAAAGLAGRVRRGVGRLITRA
ncbi:hypothetical protein [Nocardioides dongkuii]|uniref:hypothetical protein n=1 Tax=Nocardioides dongkuii TaxID=2760089 RepID=UPI0015F9BF46|nr:hypothetical protein [Nocardioides dongkuii]